jgi:DNA-binding GntR family transcriptional regulator
MMAAQQPDNITTRVAPAGRRARRTLKDEVAAHVRETILSGEALPGSKVDLDEIAAVMGVSKLPVREALIQLESEGLIETITHRGSFVAMSTPDDVRDHYHIYGLVCGLAATRAAMTMSDEALDQLEAICFRMESSEDPGVLQELNVEFHRLVNRAGSSGRLLAVLRYLASSLPGRFYEFNPGWSHDANTHHREILGYLRARDREKAGHAMAEHTRLGSEFAVKLLEERGYWSAPGSYQPPRSSHLAAPRPPAGSPSWAALGPANR